MSVDADEQVKEEERAPEFTTTQRGRKTRRTNYAESEEDAASPEDEDPLNILDQQSDSAKNANGNEPDYDEDEDEAPRRTRSQSKKAMTVMSEDDESPSIGRRLRKGRDPPPKTRVNGRRSTRSKPSSSRVTRSSARQTRSRGHEHNEDDVDYVHHSSSTSADGEGSTDEAPETSPEPEPEEEKGDDAEARDADGRTQYSLRQRREVNYYVPPPLEDVPPPALKTKKGNGRANRPANRRKGPGWSANGAELSRWMGGGGDDSVSRPFTLSQCIPDMSNRTQIMLQRHPESNRLV